MRGLMPVWCGYPACSPAGLPASSRQRSLRPRGAGSGRRSGTLRRRCLVARIEPIPMNQADGKARALLDELVQHGGEPGPMVRAMANAPALLRGYLDLTRAMKRSHVDRRITERINLAVHERLSCDYCLVAHTRAARQLGLPDSEIWLARHGTSSD